MEHVETPAEIVAGAAAPLAETAPETAPAPRALETQPEITRIPLPDHERIVDGFHRRYDEVSWAKGYKREDVEEALAIRRQMADRAKVSSEPQPDVQDENRNRFYSPEQAAKWATWKADQLVSARMGEIDKRLGPIESTFANAQEVEALSSQIQEARGWAGFEDHIEPIRAAIVDAKARGERWAFDSRVALREAYIRVVTPTLAGTSASREAEIRKKVLAEINDTQTVATGGINPARLPAGTRKAEKDMSDAELWEHVNQKASPA